MIVHDNFDQINKDRGRTKRSEQLKRPTANEFWRVIGNLQQIARGSIAVFPLKLL
jgi:hypothetical protein